MATGCRLMMWMSPGRASRQFQHRRHLRPSAHRSSDWSGQVREWNAARIAQAAGAEADSGTISKCAVLHIGR